MSDKRYTFEDINEIANTLAEIYDADRRHEVDVPYVYAERDMAINSEPRQVILNFENACGESYIETVEVCKDGRVVWDGDLEDFIDEFEISEEELYGTDKVWSLSPKEDILRVLREERGGMDSIISLIQ